MTDLLFFRFRDYPSGNDFSSIKRLARFLAQGEIGYLVEDRFVHLPSGTVMRDQDDFAPFVGIAGGVEPAVTGRPEAAWIGNSHAPEASSR